MTENKAFKIAGIKLLIEKNYEVPADLIDLESEIDDGLSMSENWYNMKEKILNLCNKSHKIMFER